MSAIGANDSVHAMLVEIIDEPGAELDFPPAENYVDLNANSHGIEQIALARRYPPLRNFLTSVNAPESAYSSVSVRATNDLFPSASDGETCHFGLQMNLVFSDPQLQANRDQYVSLASGLKQLLERDPGGSVRAVLQIGSCSFGQDQRPGYYLGIHLRAQGVSAEQAEMRSGLGLARLQQALLFSGRAWKRES